MSNAIITRRGGTGGGGLTPELVVTAPNGSTVTANALTPTRTEVGTETTKYFFIGIPLATYTVTATLGAKTKTETITISRVMQYTLELKYVVLYRYMRYTMTQRRGGYTSGLIQFSRLDLIDSVGNYFEYPANTTYVSSGISPSSVNENEAQLLKHNASYKLCGTFSNPMVITYDFKDNILDLETYNRWQWYTSGDTASYTGRNPKAFSLAFSEDGVNFVTVDSADGTWTTSNETLAYTGNITLPS